MARYQCVALKTYCYRLHAVVKDRLSYAAEQRRKASIVITSSPSTDLQGIAVAYAANALALRHQLECGSWLLLPCDDSAITKAGAARRSCYHRITSGIC